ncbi:hypothetical protein [Streptomyces sp. NPDC058695]|uniref:hypothetical protein n=1 Tax=Streptomyces sp. NPDC058695 TaxID=3346604 RepID=UPI003648C375
MSVTGDLGTADSAGHTPDQGMMIHLSVTQLLDSLGDFLRGDAGTLAFTGVDTSFPAPRTSSCRSGNTPPPGLSPTGVADALRDYLNTFDATAMGRMQDGDATVVKALRALAGRASELPEDARSDVVRDQLGRFLEDWEDAASR